MEKRARQTIEYLDATSQPDAAERADQLPEQHRALDTLGFRRLGFLESRSPGGGAMFTRKEDIAFAQRAFERGQVNEIMTSPDESASVELELFFESKLLEFRTVLEDGTIVETGTRPSRLPRPFDPLQPMRNSAGIPFLQKFLDKISGSPPWVVSHQPAAGYYLDLVKDATPQEMWLRHKQRAADIARKRRTHIPPQNDIRYVLAAFARRRELNAFREKLTNWGMIVFVAWILVASLLVISTSPGSTLFGGFLPFTMSRPLVFGLGLSAFFAAILGMAWPMRLAPWVARQLPWPRPRPLRQLLEDEGLQNTNTPAVVRKEVPGNMGEASLVAASMNVVQLRQILHKKDKHPLFSLATAAKRRKRYKGNQAGMIRVYQRYERLLWAEVKMRGFLEPRKENWGQVILKIAGATAFGLANGWLLDQVHLPLADHSLVTFVAGFILSIIGALAFDDLVGEILLATIYISNFNDEFNLWAGLVGAGIMAAIWLLFLRPRKRRQERAIIATLKERYES